MSKQPEALLLAGYWAAKNDQGEYLYSSLRFREETAAELRRLHSENEKLRALIVLDDAEWRDKHIYPVRGAAYQAWLVHVYLPVPLSASDKSPEAALKRALKKNHE